jgi:uncharacterized Zn finger protein (UPF0148 family)
MSVELACEKCQGRFLATAPGTVVCPHCGTHVSITAEAFSGQNDGGLSSQHSRPHTDDPPKPDTAAQESEELQNDAGLRDVEQSQPAIAVDAAPPSQADSASPPETQSNGESDQPKEPQAVIPTDTNDMPAIRVADPVEGVDGMGQPGDASAEAVDEQQREGDSPNQPAAVNDTPDYQDVQDEQQTLALPEGPSVPVPLASPDAEAKTITVTEFSKSENESLAADAAPMAFESSAPLFSERTAGETGPDDFPNFNAPPAETDAADIDALLENADNVTPDLRERPALSTEPLPMTDQPFPSTAPSGRSIQKTDQHSVPTRWFIILASYASAITIVCLWLLFRMMSGVHQLNLDDPADALIRGQKTVRVYSVNLQLPPGHELQIGDRQRYGHIVVEALKVSRGRLEFVHFNGEQGTVKEPTAPVLKLWLRFENVSDDQTIAPLDSILLYSNRIRTEQNYEEFHANNFVVGRDVDKNSVGRLLHVYDLNTDDVWDLKDQQLGKKLKPGESFVIYVPTGAKGVEEMVGDLVWRLHFRKGYSPSKRGVTTLIDVKFNSRAIQNEASQPADQSTASL